MKNRQAILLVTFIGSFLYSATNEATLPDRLQEAQSLPYEYISVSIKEVFKTIQPEEDTTPKAYLSFEKFIKEEKSHPVLKTVRNLFPDRDSYVKALAYEAEVQKFPILAALLYHHAKLKENNRAALFKGGFIGVIGGAAGMLAFVVMFKPNRR